MGTGGSGGQAGGNATAATCLNDWQGSSCDTCSSHTSEQGARSCVAVLDCYVMTGCASPLECANTCDYSEPTSDAAVKAALAVRACRCPQ